jgi:hypothetical protein
MQIRLRSHPIENLIGVFQSSIRFVALPNQHFPSLTNAVILDQPLRALVKFAENGNGVVVPCSGLSRCHACIFEARGNRLLTKF